MNTNALRIKNMPFVFLTGQDYIKAKEETAKSNKAEIEQGQRSKFVTKDRWIGPAGQIGFFRSYPDFRKVAEAGISVNHDARHPKTQEQTEIKTYHISGNLYRNGLVIIEKSQFDKHPYSLCVFCALNIETKKLTFVGWGKKDHLESTKQELKKGDPVYGAVDEEGNRKLIMPELFSDASYFWYFDDVDDIWDLLVRENVSDPQPLIWTNPFAT